MDGIIDSLASILPDRTSAIAEAEFVRSNNISILSRGLDGYPRRLASVSDAPKVLFQLGECDLDAAHVVAIVGTRRATAYGQRMTATLVEDLAKKIDSLVIVSGLAYGIDVSAHRAALESGVPTVGVVAHGLRTIYPAEHRDVAGRMVRAGGAIVTEYTSSAAVHRGNFLARNRIVAALADAVVVVESRDKGGAMYTASLAGSYGRSLFAVPGRATDSFSQGTNSLIASGSAAMLRSADDLIAAMGWNTRPQPGEQASFDFDSPNPLHAPIIDYLRQHPEATANDLVHALGLPYAVITSRLMDMEMADIVTSLPGGAFMLNF